MLRKFFVHPKQRISCILTRRKSISSLLSKVNAILFLSFALKTRCPKLQNSGLYEKAHLHFCLIVGSSSCIDTFFFWHICVMLQFYCTKEKQFQTLIKK